MCAEYVCACAHVRMCACVLVYVVGACASLTKVPDRIQSACAMKQNSHVSHILDDVIAAVPSMMIHRVAYIVQMFIAWCL